MAVALLKMMNGFYRAAGVFQSSVQVYRACNDQEQTSSQKVRTVFLNLLYIGAELGSFSIQRQGFSPQAQLNAELLAAGIGLGCAANQLDLKEKLRAGDVLDFVGMVALKVAQVSNRAVVLNLSLFGLSREALPCVGDLAALAGAGIQGREQISQNIHIAWDALQTFLSYYKEVASAEQLPEMSISINSNQEPALSIDSVYANLIRQVQQASSVDSFSQIPEIFKYDPVLRGFICPLTQGPIRFLRAARSAEGVIFYERDAILRHLQESPEILPINWPSNVPFSEENLTECAEHQDRINQRLQSLLDGFRSLTFTRLESQSIPDLARAIGIHDRDQSDKKLAKAIQRQFSPNNIGKLGVISVFTIPHTFSQGDPAKMARIVTVQTRSYIRKSPKIILQNRNAFVRALLGSISESDKGTLDEFSSSPSKISVCISLDLQNISVKLE